MRRCSGTSISSNRRGGMGRKAGARSAGSFLLSAACASLVESEVPAPEFMSIPVSQGSAPAWRIGRFFLYGARRAIKFQLSDQRTPRNPEHVRRLLLVSVCLAENSEYSLLFQVVQGVLALAGQ